MNVIAPQPGIMEIALYEGGASHVEGVESVLKLSSNENPLGPPPAALAALTQSAPQMHRYPPTDHAALRAAIGKVWSVDPDRVICGVGSDEVLQFITQAYAGPGDEIIHTRHGFSMYPILTHMSGATPVQVEETGRCVDVDAILGAVTPRTRIVLLTNPGNPTSTRLPDAELCRLAQNLPGSVILVIDAAYAEYAQGYDGGRALVDAHPNVMMTRTFSKIYGLGGLRVGWGYGTREMIEVLTRVRQPFNLSVPALAAAEAAVQDTGFRDRAARLNAEGRARMIGALRQLGLAVDNSATNFVLPRFADAQTADACEKFLRGRGILVRRTAGYGLPEALRITVGTADDCDRVLTGIGDFLAGAAG